MGGELQRKRRRCETARRLLAQARDSRQPTAARRGRGDDSNLLEHFLKCSQDLNAIEAAWREVRARLAVTEPASMETRDHFIVRFRAAVAWVNVRRREYLLNVSTDQKERAHDVIELGGSRTRH